VRASIAVTDGSADWLATASDMMIEAASSAVAERGSFIIALAGGTTPEALYAHLASASLAGSIEWTKAIFLFGDERCVGPSEPTSNYAMARRSLLDPLGILPSQVHRLRGEGDPRVEADRYGGVLAELLGGRCDDPSGPERPIDLVLLGLGANAHTASLFPGLAWSARTERWVVADYVEVVGSWRLSMGQAVLGSARRIGFLVAGSSKAEAVTEVLEGPCDPVVRPAQLFSDLDATRWILDAEAAAGLKAGRTA
jgi:6-phosphogluconolactonase